LQGKGHDWEDVVADVAGIIEPVEAKFRNSELKWSCYNIISLLKDGAVVWNTASGAIVLLSHEDQLKLEAFFLHSHRTKDRGLVDTLVTSGLLVPSTLDERREMLSRFRETGKSDYLQLTILPTTSCNFRCVYCYEDSSKSLRMSRDAEDRILAFVRKQCDSNPNIRTLQVAWFGGEPLLNLESIERLSSSFQKFCCSPGLNYCSGLTTNAYLLDRRTFLTLLHHGISKFHMTIDGLAKSHDLHRPLRNGDPTFETITGNLRDIACLNADFKIIVRSNFDRDNIRDAEDFVLWFKDFFKSDDRFSFYFSSIFKSGTEKDRDINFCLGVDEIDSDISHVLDFASKKGIHSYFLPLPEPKPSYCPAVMPNSWIIGPDGSVYKCTLLLDLEDRVGDLDDSGNITFEKKIDLWLKYEFEDDRKCLNCALLPVCYGGCPNARFGGHRGCLCSMETARKAMVSYYLSQRGWKGGEQEW
jgi:uncharacterized protein